MIPSPPAAIIQQADRFELAKCRCPTCVALDARFPGQGYHLALFPYYVPPSRSAIVVRLEEARKRKAERAAA